jgi:PKD repeat protein
MISRVESRIMHSLGQRFLVIGLILSILCVGGISCYAKAPTSPAPLTCDAFVAPDLANHKLLATPGYFETSEYMIGSVAVGVVLLESNGAVDTSTEDWTTTEESQVTSEIQAALNWWSTQNPSAGVTFTVTTNYRVPTSYEPINHPQTDEGLWISEAMSHLGYNGVNYFTQVRGYVNALRNNAGTDWAFAMFIVDSSNDADGCFSNPSYFAYAYVGGPFLVMTYDNDGWGINNMDRVTAHEIGHIFYATDEYDSFPEYSGYLNVMDVDGSGALMDYNDFWLSTGTIGQIGWRDTDGDGIQDIVDTFPNTYLNQHYPDPTYVTTLAYSGSVTEIPYPNNNPYGTGIDLTINTINRVQFRIDNGPWLDANATDGAFNEATEGFTFTTPTLSVGNHTIQTRGINSVGNAEISYSSDFVTILGDPVAEFMYSPENPVVNETVTFDATLSTVAGGASVNYEWDFGDGHTDNGLFVAHAFNTHGVFTVVLNVTDNDGKWDIISKNVTVNSLPVANFTISPIISHVGETVTFDATASYDLDGSITEYSWDFGDGNTTVTDDQFITHVYEAEDTYSVKLTVIDNDGLTQSSIIPITATEDFTPPTTVHDYDGLWYTTDFSVNLEATDDFVGVAETYYKLNNGATKTVSVDGQPLITTQSANNFLEYWSVDNFGNEELPHKVLTDIGLDKTAPAGSVTINSGDTYAISASVTLTLTATDATSGVHQMRFSNDGVWDTESWEPYSATKTWTLTSGDGTKTVYYQVKDSAGLVSETISASIILDTTPPAGSITIDNGATYTTSTSVTLALTASDATSGITEMRFSTADVSWTDWEAYSDSKVWTFATEEGTNIVNFQVRDQLGLISDTYFDTIVLDTKPPTVSGTSLNNDTEIKSSTVTVSWSGADATSNMDYYKVKLDDGSWINTGTNSEYTFTGASDGSHVLDIIAVDQANNSRQVQIHFSVNTSFIGGPGWTEEIVVFATIGVAVSVAVAVFIIRRARKNRK